MYYLSCFRSFLLDRILEYEYAPAPITDIITPDTNELVATTSSNNRNPKIVTTVSFKFPVTEVAIGDTQEVHSVAENAVRVPANQVVKSSQTKRPVNIYDVLEMLINSSLQYDSKYEIGHAYSAT